MTIYFDNLLIYSKSGVEPKVYLHRVFDHLCKDTLFVKYKMCKFVKDLVEYLGHIVGWGRIHMDPSKVQAITK